MSTLVGNLLEMARIESGKSNSIWSGSRSRRSSARRSSPPAACCKGIRSRCAFRVILPLVRFDALLLERVLVNLLENASKYTPPGSTVTLSAEVMGEQLSVSVSDNGPGLPKGREEAVFQKFMRGERESATPGVGLGLAICRAIIEAHQGKIVAINRPGGGASFTFTLPLGNPPVAAAETEAQAVNG